MPYGTLESADQQTSAPHAVAPLSDGDRRVAVSLLRDIYNVHNNQDNTAQAEQAREVQIMLLLNVKCEMQVVDHYSSMADWLDIMLIEN